MAEALADLPEKRQYARWWQSLPARARALEGESLREDRTIRRLGPDDLERNADLRAFLDDHELEAGDLLAYGATAEGRFGRYRLAALCLYPPEIAPPAVYCLDGPRGSAASEHRNSSVELCLYYPNDPPERRWNPEDGLRRLFDLARRHLTGEHLWRTQDNWPIEEAPHGETAAVAPNPALRLPRPTRPGRNDPCTCGSGRKAKKCCWR